MTTNNTEWANGIPAAQYNRLDIDARQLQAYHVGIILGKAWNALTAALRLGGSSGTRAVDMASMSEHTLRDIGLSRADLTTPSQVRLNLNEHVPEVLAVNPITRRTTRAA